MNQKMKLMTKSVYKTGIGSKQEKLGIEDFPVEVCEGYQKHQMQ